MAYADIALRDNGSGSFDIALASTFAQDGITYLLRDKFSSDVNPLVDANASEGSGVGYRDVTGTSFYAEDGRLRGGNNSSEGKIVYKPSSVVSGWGRVGGRTFTALMSTDDGDGDLQMFLAETAGTLNGYGIIFNNGTWDIVEPDGNTVTAVVVDNEPMKAIQYLVGITLNEERGAVYWISAIEEYDPGTDWTIPKWPTARTIWVSTLGTFTTVHPTIRANSGFTYPGGVAVEDVRLLDIASWDGADGMALVADRFDRADSASTLGGSWTTEATTTWGISSNKAYNVASAFNGRAYLDAGESDVWVVAEITSGSDVADWFGLLLRRVDANNWIRLHNNGTANVYFQTWVGGGFDDTITSTYAAFSTSQMKRWLVGCYGDEYRIFINGDETVIQPTPDTGGTHEHTNGTGFGLFGDSASGQRWDYFAIYPITFTLTTEFEGGAMPVQPVVAVPQFSDTFTNTNGTALATHNASWTEASGTWTIQSNKAEVSTAAGANHAYVDAGDTDVQASVEITMASSVSTVRSGLILRRADANNYIQVRAFVDTSQPGADEIELQEFIGGSGAVVHKCYLGNYFQDSTTYTLTAQVVGDEIFVYLDGIAQLYNVISNAALLTGTGTGLYRESSSDNTPFDNFTIYQAGGQTPTAGNATATVTISSDVSSADPTVTPSTSDASATIDVPDIGLTIATNASASVLISFALTALTSNASAGTDVLDLGLTIATNASAITDVPDLGLTTNANASAGIDIPDLAMTIAADAAAGIDIPDIALTVFTDGSASATASSSTGGGGSTVTPAVADASATVTVSFALTLPTANASAAVDALDFGLTVAANASALVDAIDLALSLIVSSASAAIDVPDLGLTTRSNATAGIYIPSIGLSLLNSSASASVDYPDLAITLPTSNASAFSTTAYIYSGDVGDPCYIIVEELSCVIIPEDEGYSISVEEQVHDVVAEESTYEIVIEELGYTIEASDDPLY